MGIRKTFGVIKCFKIELQKQMHDKNIKNWLCKFTAIYQTVYLRRVHFMVFKLDFNEAIF